MYRVLKAEMIKKDISVKQLAMSLGITERSLRNKISQCTEFKFTEAITIKKLIAEDMDLEELFKTEADIA